jgi:Mn-dependent DtxR family transcriptional regulator
MVLEQTEKIEHYLSCETVQSIKKLLQLFEQQPGLRKELQEVQGQ